jgi:beta-glucosidase
MPRAFPDGFRWGTATAAHQVEGNNTNNDWWDFEHKPGTPCREPSGDCVDQYHRYREDIELVARLGLDSYRFSLEWSRIEPSPGEFSRAELDHYRRVCATCLEFGVEPVVTFHHFTSPRWLAADDGWVNPAVVDRFLRFCEVSSRHLHDVIGRACTINEPNVVALMGYRFGLFPPGEDDEPRFHKVQENLRTAHIRSTEVLKGQLGDTPIGLTLSQNDWQPVPADDDAAVAKMRELRAEHEDFYLEACRGDDFFGVQTYSRMRVNHRGVLGPEEGVEVLPMGYDYYPESLAGTIRHAWEVTGGTPILVTENGIGTDHDEQRIRYFHTALSGVLDCIDEGIDVLGYTVWSLLDNFEWAFGYDMRFGIVDVDRETQLRTPKPSAWWLAKIVKDNALGDAPGAGED